MLTIGIDLGSTTVKYVLFGEDGRPIARDYLRHGSDVAETLGRVLTDLSRRVPAEPVRALFSGSGALGLADALGAPPSCRR